MIAFIVKVLDLSWALREAHFVADVFTTFYVWPAAHAEDPPDADWEDVDELYNEEEIASMKEFGRYVGYRVGMTKDGDWAFFVEGD